MTTYYAFLRGINVGAHNRMKMADLRAVFASLGYENVETYIQSGNVVFDAPAADEGTLRSEIRDAIDDEFGYDVPVMVRTRAELEAVVERQPFDEPADENAKRYVTFLHEEPSADGHEALLAAGSAAESFEVHGREVYSEVDGEALGSGRFTDAGKQLGMAATRRNWDVVRAVLETAS